MDKIIYRRGIKDTREFSKVEIDVPEDLNVDEFYLICIRLAKMLGYSDKNIKETFLNSNIILEDFGEGA